jgi:ribosomal protein S18 acetylase RimI-like enzyme
MRLIAMALSDKPGFLRRRATHAEIVRAFMINTTAWFVRYAESGGGSVYRRDGTLLTYKPRDGGTGSIPFPRIPASGARARIDEIVRFYADQHPFHGALFWSTRPVKPEGLEALLVARGFEWSWDPHWMALDLHRLSVDGPHPAELRIDLNEGSPLRHVDGLPYSSPDGQANKYAATRAAPKRVWQFAARLGDEVVGQGILNLTTGANGVAGIFNLGVVPGVRRRGIGSTLTLRVCRFARELGCHHAVLNATAIGEPVYRRAGFRSLGYGRTWFLGGQTLGSPAKGEQVAFAEAVGLGEIRKLDRVPREDSRLLVRGPLPSGISMMEIAVRLRQPRSALWLVEHGGVLDVLSAWDLGWMGRARRLLRANPGLVNLRTGRSRLTPMHVAVERGDLELARLLLDFGPDLSLEDDEHHSTPLGWAEHLQRKELVKLIGRHAAGPLP